MSYRILINRSLIIATLTTINTIIPQIKTTANQPPKIENQNQSNKWFYQGVIKINLKDYQGAIDDFSKAIEINPRYAEAYYQRGFIYAKYFQGQIVNSDGTVPGCVRVNQYSISCEVKITAAWKKQKQQQALKDLNRAIKIIPQYAVAYHQRGLIQDNPQDKLKDFQVAEEIYLNRALSYLDENKYIEAVRLLKETDKLYAERQKIIALSTSDKQIIDNPVGSSGRSPDSKKSPEQLMKEAREALKKSDVQTALSKYKLAAGIFWKKDRKQYQKVQQIIRKIESKKK